MLHITCVVRVSMQVIFPRASGRLRVPASAELMGRWRRGNAAGAGVSDGARSHHSGSEQEFSLFCGIIY